MKIDGQVALSPAHIVAPYTIRHASNGDFIIAGADDIANHRAWATRVDKTGKPIWEFLDESPDGWNDYSKNDQSFYDAMELSNGNSLLCGVKRIDKGIVAFLVRIGKDGRFIDERVLTPAHAGFPMEIRCIQWGDGVAVISGLAALPRATGWLTKLDAAGNIMWEKFGDQFVYSDVMSTQAGGLFLIGRDSVFKIDGEGNVLASHSVTGSDQQFVHSIMGTTNFVRIGAMASTSETVILDFDDELKGPKHIINVKNVAIKRCFDLPDGSLVLFGSRFLKNQATANVAIVSKSGAVSNLTLEPNFQSAWFYDAAPADLSIREFATVRQLNDTGKGALAWISIK